MYKNVSVYITRLCGTVIQEKMIANEEYNFAVNLDASLHKKRSYTS